MAAQTHGRSSCTDDTYVVSESSTVCSSSSRAMEEELQEDSDAPIVFLCGKCKRPVGDTLSWAGSDEDLNQIMLKRVNDNVVIGQDPYVSCVHKDLGCLVVNLTCCGCGTKLGLMYKSTPKELDYKRAIFCFSVKHIDSYQLGSAGQQVAVVANEDKPVTLEYQENIEQQMTKIKSLAVTIGHRLMEIEADLQSMPGS